MITPNLAGRGHIRPATFQNVTSNPDSSIGKGPLFIDPRTEADIPLPTTNRMLNEWQLLTDAPNLTNDFNVVVSGRSAFIAYCPKAALRSACEPKAANQGSKLLSV